MFKVGDKVKVKCINSDDSIVLEDYSKYIGLKGEIVLIKDGEYLPFIVRLQGINRNIDFTALELILLRKISKLPEWF